MRYHHCHRRPKKRLMIIVFPLTSQTKDVHCTIAIENNQKLWQQIILWSNKFAFNSIDVLCPVNQNTQLTNNCLFEWREVENIPLISSSQKLTNHVLLPIIIANITKWLPSIIHIDQVQVCWCGGDRRELSKASKASTFKNPFLLQHPFTKVINSKLYF